MDVNNYKLVKFKANKWRNLNNVEFSIGKKITVISGHNGIGKSTLLALLASTSGLKISNLNSNFHPEIYDFFYIDPSEMECGYECFNLYRATLDSGHPYEFSKRLRLKNDTSDRNTIRIIPGTYKYPLDDSSSIEFFRKKVKDDLGIGPDARVDMPTLILSLSRLLPLGESNANYRKLPKKATLFEHEAHKKYKEWYNFVLPNSIINDELLSVNKEVTKAQNYAMHIVNTMPLTQSVGQDNLSNIIHALVEFYILKLTSGYKSGLLCVDEIDVSLHPDAQIRVIQLLDRVSAELDLQIVISSHSLTIIDEISRKRKSNEEDYELVYLKDTNAPYVSKRNDYESIKLDLFSKIYRTAKPKIKVYFEDNIGLEIFNLLKDTFSEIISLCNSGDVEIPTDMLEKLNPDFNIIDPIPAYIGCDNAISLLKADNYFKDVCFVLDGDAQIKKDTKLKKDYSRKTKTYNEFLEVNVIDGRYSKKEMYPNVIYLPSYFPPEFYLFRIIYKYVKEARDLYLFWRNLEDIASDNYTSSLVNEKLRISEFKSSDDNLNINFLKGADVKQFLLDFCKDSRILVDYYSRPEHIDELISFVELYNESIEHLKRRNYSKLL